MLCKNFHWVEGLIVAGLLCAMTWMNSLQAAPEGLTGSDTFPNQLSATNSRTGNQSEFGINQKRIREGTHIDNRTGYFRQDGDGGIFITDDGYELSGLPNLNLERVVRTLKTADESKTIRWRVSGDITEFGGRNYIFITRAVYKSTAPPPIPVQIPTDEETAK